MGRPVPEETHPLTPILIIGHPLSSSSIYNDQRHPLCSFYVLDSPLVQPLSRSSLVLDPQLHTPYISSPNHYLPMLCHLYIVSLFPYRPGLTYMQHAASHTTTVQPSSHNQRHVLKQSTDHNQRIHSLALSFFDPLPDSYRLTLID